MPEDASLIRPELEQRLIAVRRALHRRPELSGGEMHTAGAIGRELERAGLPFRPGVGGYGIVVDLAAASGVGTVLLRADMDALPITEATGLPFSSEVTGVMHACGHDGHAAMLLGAALLLAGERALPAPVRLIFQPAEETGKGAPAMIRDNVLDGVAVAFGGHIDRTYPPGVIAVDSGPVNASTDDFVIMLQGPGGHAARPHESADPVTVGALIVAGLQTIVARTVDPGQPAVVTVGSFHGGTAPNVIASEVRLEGTARALDPAVRERLVAAVRTIAEITGAAHGVAVTVRMIGGTPPVLNAPEPTALARAAAESLLGRERVPVLTQRNMGGEDFGCYAERVPSCFVRLGARPEGASYPAHSPRFDFHEGVIAVGAAYFHRVALDAGRWLARRQRGG
jgi:amidohydrolase